MTKSPALVTFLCSLITIAGIIYGFYVCNRVSLTETTEQFKERHLKKGWFLGQPYRDPISQYEQIRSALPILGVLTIVQLAVSHVSMCVRSSGITGSCTVQKLRDFRIVVNACFSILCFLALHGSNTIWILVIDVMQYVMVSLLVNRRKVAVTYVWCSVIVLFYFLCTDERSIDIFDSMHDWLKYRGFVDSSQVMIWAKFLKNHQGVMSGWSNIYRLSFIRIVSYQMDFIWYVHDVKPHQSTAIIEPSFYSFFNYMGYINYLPLYLAGPITTFNSFVSGWTLKTVPDYRSILSLNNVWSTVRSTYWRSYVNDLLFWFGFLLVFDISTHYMYTWKLYYNYDWKILSSAQLTCLVYVLSYWHFWGKYFIILQMGKLWATADCLHGECAAPLDDVEIPDDLPMTTFRCNSTLRINLDTWHTSFIYFAMRYLYVPLGGMKQMFVSLPAVFMFSAWVHGISVLWTFRAILTQALPLTIECLLRYGYYNYWMVTHQSLKNCLAFVALVLFDMTAVTAYGWPAEVPARYIFYMIFLRNGVKSMLCFVAVFVFFCAKVHVVLAWEKSPSHLSLATQAQVGKQGNKDDIISYSMVTYADDQTDVATEEATTELEIQPLPLAEEAQPSSINCGNNSTKTEWNIYERALTIDQTPQYQSHYHPLFVLHSQASLVAV